MHVLKREWKGLKEMLKQIFKHQKQNLKLMLKNFGPVILCCFKKKESFLSEVNISKCITRQRDEISKKKFKTIFFTDFSQPFPISKICFRNLWVFFFMLLLQAQRMVHIQTGSAYLPISILQLRFIKMTPCPCITHSLQ